MRADSGCRERGRQEAVGEEEDSKERVGWGRGEGLRFTVLLCHHQWCHCGRSGVGWEGEEVVLTSSSSLRSARVCYHVLLDNDASKRLSRDACSTQVLVHTKTTRGANKEPRNASNEGKERRCSEM